MVSAAVLVLLAPILVAQPAPFGDPVPLTATRYGTTRGNQPLLISNGHEPLLFWLGDRRVQVTRRNASGFEHSRAVLDADGIDARFDAVWTGRHFLVVSPKHIGTTDTLFGRLLDAEGAPIGEPFAIIDGRNPRIAFDGGHVLLLFVPSGTSDVHSYLLSADGKPADVSPRALGTASDGRIALASNGRSFAAVIPRNFEPRLILFDSRGRVTSQAVIARQGSSAAIASDGVRYLATLACGSYGPCGPAIARIVAADGTLAPELEIDGQYPRDPSAVWTGSNWTIAYTREATQTQPATIQQLTLDAEARAIGSRAERAGTEASLAALDGEVVTAHVGGRRLYDTIFVDGVAASITATRQQVLATATSRNGALIVWQEIGNDRTTLHTGVRDRAGRWVEQQILTIPLPECCYEETLSALAASDGREFLIVTSSGEGLFTQRLDAQGAPAGARERIQSFWDHALVWTGSEYRMVGRDIDPRIGSRAAFAADGAGKLFAAWPVQTYQDHAPVTLGVATLNLPDASQSMISDDSVFGVAAAWDGSRFVIAWSGRDRVKIARVGEPAVRSFAGGDAGNISLTPLTDGSVAMLFIHDSSYRIAFLRANGTTSAPMTVTDDLLPARLVALPAGGVALIRVIEDRLVMRVAAPPPVPARRRALR